MSAHLHVKASTKVPLLTIEGAEPISMVIDFNFEAHDLEALVFAQALAEMTQEDVVPVPPPERHLKSID